MIAGIVAPSCGAIVHDGRTVSGPNTATGYMTQQHSLLPWRTAVANVALPLILRGTPKAQVDARVAEMLALVG